MKLSFLDNIVLSSNELEFIAKEQERLRKQIEEYDEKSQLSLRITNVIYYDIIRDNSPESANNKWKMVNGVWLLSGKVKLLGEESFYKDLFDKIGIKYKIDKVAMTTSGEEIFTISYELKIDEYNEIRKYFEAKINIPDEMVLSSLTEKGVIKKSAYVDEMQAAGEPVKTIGVHPDMRKKSNRLENK